MLSACDSVKNISWVFHPFIEVFVGLGDVLLAICSMLFFCFALYDPVIGAYDKGVVVSHLKSFCQVL